MLGQSLAMCGLGPALGLAASLSLQALAQRILNFQRHYQAIARPFEWRFTRNDLRALLHKLDSAALAA